MRLAVLLLALAGACAPTAASSAPTPRQAQSSEELVDWYYAAVFGTGVYTAGDRTVGVVQIPFAYTWQPASAQGWGMKFTLPVTFGFYDFNLGDIAAGDLPNSVSTASVMPGVELETQVLDNWRLQPFAAVGKGRELDKGQSALLYHAGVKSQLTFPLGRGRFMLGNTLSYAGYSSETTGNQPLSRLITGLNFSFPTNGTIADRPVDFGIHVIHYLYTKQLPFPLTTDIDNKARNEFEVAFSLSTQRPIPFGAFGQSLFDFDRVGLAFRAGTDVAGIRLFFSLPY
jgi:hypothetical protein